MAAALGLLAALAIGAATAEPAAAQQPDICQQYPDLPQCQGEDPGGGAGGQVPGGAAADLGGAGEAQLPFTGYPLTPLLLLALLLLLLGLAILAYQEIRDRLRERSEIPSGTA